MDWNKYFMSIAALVSMKSKDQKTHHGAVIVGHNNEIRSTGYNSFVRGLNDNVPERQERPEKYHWFEHSERNAIYNAALHGVSLEGCTMYVSGVPCTDCARAIIQSGIKVVVALKKWDEVDSKLWSEHTVRTLEMFKETGVRLEYYEGEIIDNPHFLFNEKVIR